MQSKETLVSRDSKGKIRLVTIDLFWREDGYVIQRVTGQWGGKSTFQPEIVVSKGKAGRTVTEQATLEFNSRIKKYLDKGYKKVPEDVDDLNEEVLNSIVGVDKTNQDGVLKPMLAKQADKVATKVFDKEFYASRKINGVRCLIFCNNGEIKTASRGSVNYDLAILHIISNPKLVEFFDNHPDAILDGEIYKHGMTLNQISGICRTQSTVADGKDLQFYWYDIVDTTASFDDRLQTMLDWKEELELADFDPYRQYSLDELAIQFVPQELVSGWFNMKAMHDKFVKEGFEGLVIRSLTDVYGPGKRSNAMIKIKEYKDAEYTIVGISEGRREEDMCFIMQTESGAEFNAKPVGDRALKQYYRDHIDEMIGKQATVKYFEMSGAGTDIPQQPIFIGLRDYE